MTAKVSARRSCSATCRPGRPSLALIVEDPDIPEQFKSQVPGGVFDHWVIWDIAADSKGFAEGAGKGGINAAGGQGFFPACPPDKAHRLLLQALRAGHEADGAAIKSKADLQAAMAGHIIQQAAMIGMYGPSVGRNRAEGLCLGGNPIGGWHADVT